TLERFAPSISCVEWRHDLDLKKTPITVTVDRRLPGGGKEQERITCVPDGWIDMRLKVEGQDKRRRRCAVLELDRGTVTNIAEFKKKITAYYSYALSDEYKTVFNTNLCTVAYGTTAGHDRLKHMLKMCEEELTLQ